MPRPEVHSFFDTATRTISHVAWDGATLAAAIIDSVLDYDETAGRTSRANADAIVAFVHARQLKVEWIIETHVHADHLSAAPYLRAQLGGRIGIGEKVGMVQSAFGRVFDPGPSFRADGTQFDHLFADGEAYALGTIAASALATPGHTPACMTHLIGDAAFVGDTLFSPDYGSARCDFPGGDARALYRSAQTLFALPDPTRVFLCHDYPVAGRNGVMTRDDHRRTAARQHPPACGYRRGRVRAHACRARCDAVDAALAVAVGAGEHLRGRTAAARAERHPLSQDTARYDLIGAGKIRRRLSTPNGIHHLRIPLDPIYLTGAIWSTPAIHRSRSPTSALNTTCRPPHCTEPRRAH